MKLINISIITFLLIMTHLPCQGITIAFLFALEQDEKSFMSESATLIRTETLGERTLKTYRLGSHTIIATLLTSGQTESAVSTEMILAKRAVDAVVSTGVVGAIDASLNIGDIVQVDQIVAWQVGSHGPGGWSETPRSRPAITPWNIGKVSLPAVGTASGDVFIASESERIRLRSASGMPVVDMNLHGIQTAANAHHRPALHLRIVSDRAGDDAPEEFRRFTAAYRGELGRRVAELLKSLPDDVESPGSYPGLRALESKN